MARQPTIPCDQCGKLCLKKDLGPISMSFNGIDSDGTKWTRNIHTKNGCCSKECNTLWREKIRTRIEEEEGRG